MQEWTRSESKTTVLRGSQLDATYKVDDSDWPIPS